MSVETGFDYSCAVQPMLSPSQCIRLRAAGMERCCLALDTSDATIETAYNLLAAGINLDGYRELVGLDYAAQAIAGTGAFSLIGARYPGSIRRYWLTAEQDAGAGADWLTAQLQAAVNAVKEYDIGIYTGAWYWPRYVVAELFPGLPLWHASYDGIAALGLVNYGGWHAMSAHQYASSVTVLSDVASLDLDVWGV